MGIRLFTRRNLWCMLLCGAVLASYSQQLADLVTFSFAQDQYSYIVLVPLASLALGFRERAAIFSEVHWALVPGMTLIFLGLAGTVLQERVWPAESAASLSATTGCIWALVAGIFTLCYGTRAVRAALFPIMFLLLMVPVPERALDSASLFLQKASYQLTYLFMTLARTPVLQKGFALITPEGSIEVAAQCSGIRSTLGLLIGSLVAGHLFLRSTWKCGVLALSVIPVSIFKNALRIVVLYWLGSHTDQYLLTSLLHHYGGIPFSMVALGVLGPLLWLLRRTGAPRWVAIRRQGSEATRGVG